MLPPPAELAKLPDDLIGEFFLRLPTDDPACLLRASLACKRWRRILADQAFRRTHRALHRRPSLLGFFHVVSKDVPYLTRFVPNDPAPCRPAGRDFQGWLLLDCRHGLALFATPIPSRVTRVTHDLIVWDPLTDVQHRLPRCSPMPAVYGGTDLMYNAAVLCAAPAEGCDHSGCHRGPFSVVVLFGENNYTGYAMSARVYSSKTGNWSEMTSLNRGHPDYSFPFGFSSGPSALVGDTLYFRVHKKHTLKYQLCTHCLSVINLPPSSVFQGATICLTSTVDSGLGFAGVDGGTKQSVRVCLFCACGRKAPTDSDNGD